MPGDACYAQILEDVVRAQKYYYCGGGSEDRVQELHGQHVAPDDRVDTGYEVDHSPAGTLAGFHKLICDGRVMVVAVPPEQLRVTEVVVSNGVAAKEVLTAKNKNCEGDDYAHDQRRRKQPQ